MMNSLISRPSWLTRLGLTLTLVLALVSGVVLSAIFFALFLALTLVAGGWLWWRTRRLRRQLREQFIEGNATLEPEQDFIEGEYQVLEQRRIQGTVVELRKPPR